MSIGNIIRLKQPDVYKQLIKMANKNKSHKKYKNENLDFEDFEKMMRHDSHKRVGGVVRQVKHG